MSHDDDDDAEIPLEVVDLAIAACVCHDLAGSLGSLSTNVAVASELLGDASGAPATLDVAQLRDLVSDMSIAVDRLTVHLEDLRDVLHVRPAGEVAALSPTVQAALRLARQPLSRAKVTCVASRELTRTDADEHVARATLVHALSRSIAALARCDAVTRIEIGPTPSREGVTLGVPNGPTTTQLAVRLGAIRRSVEHAGGALVVEGDESGVHVSLSIPIPTQARR